MAEDPKPTVPDEAKAARFCIDWIHKIDKEASVIQDETSEAINYLNSEPSIVPLVEGRSKFTTTDLFDIIEWVKPALLEIFAGGGEVVVVEPSGPEDVEPAKRQQQLANTMIRVKNPWFLILNDVISEMGYCRNSFVKYRYVETDETFDKEFKGLNQMELDALLQEPGAALLTSTASVGQGMTGLPGNIMGEGATTEPAGELIDATIQYTVHDEYVELVPCPHYDVGIPATAKDIKSAPFVYHKVRMQEYEIDETYGEGTFAKIKDFKEEFDRANNLYQEYFADIKSDFFYDKDNKEYILYECYYKDSKTGESRFVLICGYEKLKDEKNRYNKAPFQGATVVKMAHRLRGKSFFNILKELQRQRTALMRQIYDNVYQSNYRRYFGDPKRVNMDDYLNNNVTNAFVRVKGDPQTCLMPEQKGQLPAETYQVLEMLNTERDYHSGVPRAFQGVNSNVLNDTYRGQNQQVQQAAQRVQMLARLFAEMFVKPLVYDVINCCIQFMSKPIKIRYMQDWMEITPDNIVGKFDLQVNVGLGTGNKDMIVAQMQQLLGLYAQVFKAGIPVVTPQNVYNVLAELVKAMGHKDVSNFVTDPQTIQQLQQVVQQMMVLPSVAMDPMMQQLVMQLAQLVMLPQGPGQGGVEPFPGQNTPAQPAVPQQPNNPRATPDGGGFYA